MHIDKESQTDFFGPVRPGGQNDEPYPEDELQPAVLLKRPPEQDLPDDVFEGPAPGNEKNQVPQKKTDPGKSRRRGGQHRTIRRKGPARYAARRKDAESEVDQKPTKAPKARATAPKAAELKTKSVATDQDAVAAKKPKSGRTSKPKAEVPVEKTKPAKAPKPGAQPKASKPKAAKAVAEEKKEEAAPAKKTTRSRRKVAETPPTDVPSAVTAATPAPVAPVEIEKPKDAGIVAAAAPPAAEPVVERPKSGRRRSSRRGRKTEAPQAAEQSSAPAAETASATVQESQAVAPGESVDTPAPAPVGPPAKGHRQSRRDRERQREVERPRRPPRPAPVSEVLKKGDEIMVQVIKEEIGLKGARISSYVSLPGRYLVLLPYPNEEGGISRKVESLEERKRLKRMIREIRQDIGEDEVGFIVRTAGVDREEKDIRNDVEFLMQEWELVREREKTARPPDMVYDDSNILYRLCRDVFDESISEILIDSHKEADKLRETLRALIPGLVDRVAVYENPENIFTHYQVERMIQKAARRKVWLKSGGYIIIDEAEALTAIDVNTGKFIGKDDQEKMILKTNLEAARTIAKELKLRDIGGLIVVDFIDMRDSRNRDQLLNEFRAHLRRDRSKTSVSSISEFGLVEMTRKRVRQSLRKTLFMDCPYCQGAGVVLNEQQIWIHIKNEIIRIAEGASPAPNLNIVVNPRIRAHLEQNYRDALTRFEDKYGIEIRVGMSDVFHVENYAIERMTRSGERISLPVGVEANGGGEH
jgi:ribonuclease G